MTTILKRDKRRCDLNCYAAHGPASDCECVCGGANHGKGYEAAMKESVARLRKGELLPSDFIKGSKVTLKPLA